MLQSVGLTMPNAGVCLFLFQGCSDKWQCVFGSWAVGQFFARFSVLSP